MPNIPSPPVTGISGMVGVGVATAQIQSVSSVHDGFLQVPSKQVRPEEQSLVALQPLLQEAGGTGVAVGVGVGVRVGVFVGAGQIQSVSAVQDGFRQDPLTQVRPDWQSESAEQPLLQDAGGVGVAVGVGVRVDVGVDVRVPVGVGVRVPVGVDVDVKVLVGVGVRVPVGVEVDVNIGVEVLVTTGVEVGVGVEVDSTQGIPVSQTPAETFLYLIYAQSPPSTGVRSV